MVWEAPPYKDPGQPVEARVKDLLSRMTLQEKAAQMAQIERRVATPTALRDLSLEACAAKEVARLGMGPPLRSGPTWWIRCRDGPLRPDSLFPSSMAQTLCMDITICLAPSFFLTISALPLQGFLFCSIHLVHCRTMLSVLSLSIRYVDNSSLLGMDDNLHLF
jgi:hypothetical protein